MGFRYFVDEACNTVPGTQHTVQSASLYGLRPYLDSDHDLCYAG